MGDCALAAGVVWQRTGGRLERQGVDHDGTMPMRRGTAVFGTESLYETRMWRNASFLISTSVVRRNVLSRVGGDVQLGVGGLRL